VAWAPVTALLLAGAWRFSGRLFPADPPAAQALHTAILAWAVIVGAATVLGSIGVLFPATLLAVVAVSAVLLGWKAAPAVSEQDRGPADRSGLILWGALMVFWAGHIVFQGLLRFPSDWDSLMYHIPLVDQWLQARSLYAPRDATWFFPGNNELLGLWLVAPFSGDFLIALNNVPAVTVLILGGVELARQFGLGRPLTICTALALVANHIVFRQITDAENDVAVAGLFLAGLAYGIRHAKTGSGADLAFAAAAIGLLAGVKYYALGYAALAGASLVAATWCLRGYRPAAKAMAIGLLGCLLLGGYWYIRNIWLKGTPIYPRGFTASTDALSQFPGWQTGFSSSTLLFSGRPEVLPLTLKAVWGMAGPCHAIALLGLPVSTAWLIVTGLWRRRSEAAPPTGALRLVLVLALLGAWLLWSITPFAVETTPGTMNQLLGQYLPVRFGLSFLSVAVIALAIVADDVGRGLGVAGSWWTGQPVSAVPMRVLVGVPMLLLAAGATYQFFRQVLLVMAREDLIDGLLVGGNLALLGTIFALCRMSWPGARRWLAAGSAVVVLGSFAWAAAALADRWHAEFTLDYDRSFNGNTFSALDGRDPATTRICALSYRYYPFLGSRRQFQVARPLRLPTYESLRDYLLLHEVNVVVAVADPFPNGRYVGMADWLDERPAVFRRVDAATPFAIFEVNVEKLRFSK
jgi:hypothetical protein